MPGATCNAENPFDVLAEHAINEYRAGRTKSRRDFAAENAISLETGQRAQLAEDLVIHLRAAVPGSVALLRGSLAAGGADAYSDIDLLWEVPDPEFTAAVALLPGILSHVGTVASLRFDPDFQRSAKRRLAFIRFSGVPLYWRVDLDTFARSVGRDPDYDRDNPSARGNDWSMTESSLANAVAAIKAHLRGRDEEAAALLTRAEERAGLNTPEAGLQRRILMLVDAVAVQDVTLASFAADVRRLAAEAF